MKIKDKYIVLCLKTMNREHFMVDSFNLDYRNDDLLHELRDIIAQPKYKTFKEFCNKYSHIDMSDLYHYCKDHPMDMFTDEILNFVWQPKFPRMTDGEIIHEFNQIKQKLKKHIRNIENLAKKQEKENFCCENEKRNMNGGCDNCGDPCY